jgi:hypothetical protein
VSLVVAFTFRRANSVEDAVRRGQRQVEQVKVRLGMQMDDRAFQASLLETQVYYFSRSQILVLILFLGIGHVNKGPHEMEL